MNNYYGLPQENIFSDGVLVSDEFKNSYEQLRARMKQPKDYSILELINRRKKSQQNKKRGGSFDHATISSNRSPSRHEIKNASHRISDFGKKNISLDRIYDDLDFFLFSTRSKHRVSPTKRLLLSCQQISNGEQELIFSNIFLSEEKVNSIVDSCLIHPPSSLRFTPLSSSYWLIHCDHTNVSPSNLEKILHTLTSKNPQKTILSLNLSHNSFSLSLTTPPSPLLTSLYNLTELRHLNLSHNNLSDQAFSNISNHLKCFRKLKILDLSHNALTHHSSLLLKDILNTNNLTIEHLLLRHNKINSLGGSVLFQCILEYERDTSRLRFLDLGFNALGQGEPKQVLQMSKDLANVVLNNNTLYHLCLDYNGLSYEVSVMLGNALLSNSTLYALHYEGNYPFEMTSYGLLLPRVDVRLPPLLTPSLKEGVKKNNTPLEDIITVMSSYQQNQFLNTDSSIDESGRKEKGERGWDEIAEKRNCIVCDAWREVEICYLDDVSNLGGKDVFFLCNIDNWVPFQMEKIEGNYSPHSTSTPPSPTSSSLLLPSSNRTFPIRRLCRLFPPGEILFCFQVDGKIMTSVHFESKVLVSPLLIQAEACETVEQLLAGQNNQRKLQLLEQFQQVQITQEKPSENKKKNSSSPSSSPSRSPISLPTSSPFFSPPSSSLSPEENALFQLEKSQRRAVKFIVTSVNRLQVSPRQHPLIVGKKFIPRKYLPFFVERILRDVKIPPKPQFESSREIFIWSPLLPRLFPQYSDLSSFERQLFFSDYCTSNISDLSFSSKFDATQSLQQSLATLRRSLSRVDSFPKKKKPQVKAGEKREEKREEEERGEEVGGAVRRLEEVKFLAYSSEEEAEEADFNNEEVLAHDETTVLPHVVRCFFTEKENTKKTTAADNKDGESDILNNQPKENKNQEKSGKAVSEEILGAIRRGEDSKGEERRGEESKGDMKLLFFESRNYDCWNKDSLTTAMENDIKVVFEFIERKVEERMEQKRQREEIFASSPLFEGEANIFDVFGSFDDTSKKYYTKFIKNNYHQIYTLYLYLSSFDFAQGRFFDESIESPQKENSVTINAHQIFPFLPTFSLPTEASTQEDKTREDKETEDVSLTALAPSVEHGGGDSVGREEGDEGEEKVERKRETSKLEEVFFVPSISKKTVLGFFDELNKYSFTSEVLTNTRSQYLSWSYILDACITSHANTRSTLASKTPLNEEERAAPIEMSSKNHWRQDLYDFIASKKEVNMRGKWRHELSRCSRNFFIAGDFLTPTNLTRYSFLMALLIFSHQKFKKLNANQEFDDSCQRFFDVYLFPVCNYLSHKIFTWRKVILFSPSVQVPLLFFASQLRLIFDAFSSEVFLFDSATGIPKAMEMREYLERERGSNSSLAVDGEEFLIKTNENLMSIFQFYSLFDSLGVRTTRHIKNQEINFPFFASHKKMPSVEFQSAENMMLNYSEFVEALLRVLFEFYLVEKSNSSKKEHPKHSHQILPPVKTKLEFHSHALEFGSFIKNFFSSHLAKLAQTCSESQALKQQAQQQQELLLKKKIQSLKNKNTKKK